MNENTDEMIRVNHAGEYGATRIYAGQLFILTNDETIRHMAEQEQEHLDAFQQMIIERRVRPSLLQPIWYVGGFLMGALTAAMGRNVAHACTAAVETVIDKHYQDQISELSISADIELKDLVTKCHKEECEHHDIAINEAGVDLAMTYPIITSVVERITKVAIEIAKKV
ncbi:MAG: demethoxyubiquinone hydroxylase family protein [Candidatus Paracaedibacteraceae bacterium]|nr:demethoxyubiquinone hydroxylase family protein [Candidatus Paracaedibacteraceae bacterium]